MRKKNFVTLVSLNIFLFSFLSSPAHSAGNSWMDETIFSKSSNPTVGVFFDDRGLFPQTSSALMARVSRPSDPVPTYYGCSSLSDPKCKDATQTEFISVLPVCQDSIDIDCIVGLEVVNQQGKSFKASFIKKFIENGVNDFPGGQSNRLPQGSTPSVWNFSDAPGIDPKQDYLVNFRVLGYKVLPTFNSTTGNEQFKFSAFDSFISPITYKFGNYLPSELVIGREAGRYRNVQHIATSFQWANNSQDSIYSCLAVTTGICAQPANFAPDYSYKLTARLNQSPSGWIHGRLQNAEVTLNESSGQYIFTIQGKAVDVPVVGVRANMGSEPNGLGDWFWRFGEDFIYGNNSTISTPKVDSDDAFRLIDIWSKQINDQANNISSRWSARTLSYSGDRTNCLKDKGTLIGVVATNSMLYSSGPPKFNSQLQTLDYTLASPHLTDDGKVFRGVYELQLRSDVARCLYNFTKAPISASISIVKEQGSTSISTTTISEKNNWLKLGAFNFTFSKPVVRVKLSQKKTISKKPAKK